MTKNDVRTFCHVSLRFHKTHTQKNPKPSNGHKIFTKFKKCLTKEHSLNFLRPDINFGHFCCCNGKIVVFFYDYCCCYIFIFSTQLCSCLHHLNRSLFCLWMKHKFPLLVNTRKFGVIYYIYITFTFYSFSRRLYPQRLKTVRSAYWSCREVNSYVRESL